MANILYDNCFISSYKTVVKEVVEENGLFWHALEETIFYVESGGMDSDEGLINQHRVLKLKKEKGKVWHLLDVKLEGKVTLSIDFHLRFARSQIHTAQHLISGIMHNVYGAKTLSHHIHAHDNDIVFDMPNLKERQLHELEVIINGLIRDDLPIHIFYPTKKEASLYPIKNVALLDEVRMVKIGDVSVEPCGCIHVPSLRYLQMIKITRIEKCKTGSRVHFVCGDQLLNNYHRYYSEMSKASKLVAQPFDYLEVGILNLMRENKGLLADMMVLKEKYVEALIKQLDKNERFHVFEDIDLRIFLQLCAKYREMQEELFIFEWKQDEKVHIYIGNKTSSDDIFKQIAARFNFQGGGNSLYAQGGGVYQDGLEAYLLEIIDSFAN